MSSRSLPDGDHRTELSTVEPSTAPRNVPPGLLLGGFPLPARWADHTSAGRLRVRSHLIRQIVVIEVAGRLGDVVEDLDWAIQLALADEPRGVACDLTGVLGVDPCPLAVLAMAGRHVRDWSGIPVAMVSPDPRVREALSSHPLGGELIVTKSLLFALYAVLRAPVPALDRIRLRSHPTAPHVARQFVTDTLSDWQLATVVPSACLVTSELVTNSTLYDSTGEDIDLSVEWNLQSLRLTVRDHSSVRPHQARPGTGLHGRGLIIVDGISLAHGVLPTNDGGKLAWAVLKAPKADSATTPAGEGKASTRPPVPEHVAKVGRSRRSHPRPYHDSSNYLG